MLYIRLLLGKDLVAAGYAIYGASTLLVLASQGGTVLYQVKIKTINMLEDGRVALRKPSFLKPIHLTYTIAIEKFAKHPIKNIDF